MRTRNGQTVTVYKDGRKDDSQTSSYERWWSENAADKGVSSSTSGSETWSSSYRRSDFKGGYSWTETLSGTNTESVTKGGVTTSKQTNWSWTRSGTVWDDGRNSWSESWSKSNWENGRSVPGESETARGSYDPKGTGTQTNNLPQVGEVPRLNKPPKNVVDLNKQPKYKPQPSQEFYELPIDPKFKNIDLYNNLPVTSTSNQPPGEPDKCLELLREIVNLGKELKKRYDDLRLDDQDLYNRRLRISDPPVPRIPPLSGRKTQVTGDPGSWDGHKEKYRRVQEELNKKLKEFQDNDDCSDDDPWGYGMQVGYDQALEYSQKEPPARPDIRNRSSLLARALELGGQVIDGVLWVGSGVAGFALLALEVIARLLGFDLRFKT